VTTQPKHRLSPEEYLAIERKAAYKSEYYRGETYAMSGASREHNLITLNIGASLHRQLRQRPCEVYQSDMRVKVSPTGLYTYPDVIVVRGQPRFEDAHGDTLLSPTLIVEVLSESTEGYDRGAKFEQYRTLPSLKDYLLVAQDRCHVEHFVHQPDGGWLLSEAKSPEATLRLGSIDCELPLAEVYEKVPLPAPPEAEAHPGAGSGLPEKGERSAAERGARADSAQS
jgi:Uma2 family endonuclease